MACFLEQRFDSDSQLHLNNTAIRHQYSSSRAKFPVKIVIQYNLLGNDSVRMVLHSGKQYFRYEYVDVEVLLVYLRSVVFVSAFYGEFGHRSGLFWFFGGVV